MKPYFSVILPTFNSANYIENALSSILNQSFINFEILIIDGLSSDNTLEICESFKDERIKIFTEVDEGIYDAMNKGINLAKGDWLYFLGSDDSLFDHKVLEDVSLFIKKTLSPIVYGNVKITGNAGWSTSNIIYDGAFNLRKILVKNICHQAVFYSQLVFNDERYNLNYNICADYDLNLRLFKGHKFEYMDRIIALFIGGGESTINIDSDFNKSEIVVFLYFWQLYKNEFKDYNYSIYSHIFKTKNPIKKIFLILVYLKHKLSFINNI